MITILLAVAAGVVFAIGLLVSGMTDPARVISFLDVTGAWDPSLAFVMAAAIAVHAPVAWLARRRRAPVLGDSFCLPALRSIDARLVLGATVFGVGWGLSGYCPGPALVSLGGGALPVAVFVAAVIASTALTRRIVRTDV